MLRSEVAFIATLQRRAITHGGPSTENLTECNTLGRLVAWHGAFMRGEVEFSWAHYGPMEDVTPHHIELLQAMTRYGFISDNGTPEQHEISAPTRPPLMPPMSLRAEGEDEPVFDAEMTEYLSGFIDRRVLAHLDLCAPLVALIDDGRRLVIHGQACELPPALGAAFKIKCATARRPRAHLHDRILVGRPYDTYNTAPRGIRAALRATHSVVEFHMYGDSPMPFYDLILARLRAAYNACA